MKRPVHDLVESIPQWMDPGHTMRQKERQSLYGMDYGWTAEQVASDLGTSKAMAHYYRKKGKKSISAILIRIRSDLLNKACRKRTVAAIDEYLKAEG